jgi:hypothetical protein
MLWAMWAVPLVASGVAFVFAGLLGRRWLASRQPFELFWVVALAMYGVASLALTIGVASGWTRLTFDLYWALGACLNVPFLAAGELALLVRRRWVPAALWIVLVFLIAWTVAVLRAAEVDATALAQQLPAGREVFGPSTPAQRLPSYMAYPAYAILVAGALWSAWKMRGRPELKDRFVGTLLIALGATIVAAGSGFAAGGLLVGFTLTLVAGISVMFWGFLRAARRRAPVPTASTVAG